MVIDVCEMGANCVEVVDAEVGGIMLLSVAGAGLRMEEKSGCPIEP